MGIEQLGSEQPAKVHLRSRSDFTWESLVTMHPASGKATHDARIVAAMKEHGETSIFTFNRGDFTRYPDIVVNPAELSLKSPVPL